MEYSIYHIENDIDCHVLKFGKELCIAIAGEDSVINLCKGRHKLTFVSTENKDDNYTIVYEVSENGIEDFIDVELIPVRDSRLEKERIEYENELARQKAIEQARLEEERLKKEKLAVEERERKSREEAEAQARIERERLEYYRLIKERVYWSMDMYRTFVDVSEYDHCGLKWIKDTNELYYLSEGGERITDSIYKKVSRFSDGLASVSTDGSTFHFINKSGNRALDYDFQSHSHFFNNRALIYRCSNNTESDCILIDAEGNILKQYPIKSTKYRNALRLMMARFKGILAYYDDTEAEPMIKVISVFTQETIYNIKMNTLKD